MSAAIALAVAVWLLAGPAPIALGGFAGTFADDDGSIHEPNIEAIAFAGITAGCDEADRFCPGDAVTRGQMATFLARALELTGAAPDVFVDDASSVHEPNINLVAAAGITLGCGDGVFCPADAVSRAQMASFLVRALDDLDAPTTDYFIDDTGNTHEGSINTLAANGITSGCNAAGNFYCPQASVTRAQMATFLVRALGLDPIQPTPAPPDNDPDYYTTPAVLGTGARIVNVPTSGSPTLQQAFDSALPGDRIVLASGRHALAGQGDQVLSRSGTPSAWIEIRGADGAMPTIDLQGTGEFRISASYVLVEHLEIISGGGNNLHIAPGTSDVTDVVVRDVRIAGLNSGPGAAIKVNRNNPADTGVNRIYIESCDVSGAIGNAVIDGVGVDTAVVRDCWIHDNAPGSHGIFFKGGSEKILIERNMVSGIRGNAALQLGGNTGAEFWNPDQPEWEGVNQVARNNIIADFDDSAVEIRGVQTGRVYHNTIIGDTSFAIFRLSLGNAADGGASDNDDIEVVNNLVVSTSGSPQYARNDGAADSLTFSHQLWGGTFVNASSGRTGIPAFPATGDAVVSGSGLSFVLVSTDDEGLSGISDGIARYTPLPGSIVTGRGTPIELVSRDMIGASRSTVAPTIGAIEGG